MTCLEIADFPMGPDWHGGGSGLDGGGEIQAQFQIELNLIAHCA